MKVRATVGLTLVTLALAACTGQQAVQQGGSVEALDYYTTVFSDTFQDAVYSGDGRWSKTDVPTANDQTTVFAGSNSIYCPSNPSFSGGDWKVVQGSIDLFGYDTWWTHTTSPTWNPPIPLCDQTLEGGNNTCIDLIGRGSNTTNIIESKAFSLVPGNYRLSFHIGTGVGAYDTDSTDITLKTGVANLVDEFPITFPLTNDSTNPPNYVPSEIRFNVPTATSANLRFSTASPSTDATGLLLDNVKVERIFGFSGFQAPVSETATNVVKAGQAIPLKFSFGENLGTEILAGNPVVTWVSCDLDNTPETFPLAETAGGSGLSYDPITMQYTWVWKTLKSYAGKCINLTMNFDSGDPETVSFRFTK